MSLHQKFLQVVSQYPDKSAIILADGKAIDYQQLNNDIEIAKKYLQEFYPDQKYFGILADQSYFAIVWIIAIMFARRTVLLIDPRLDKEKISEYISPYTSYYFADFDQEIPNLHYLNCAKFIKPNHKTNQNNDQSDISLTQNSLTIANPESSGYVIFTSGSTGEPKAVFASIESLKRLIEALRQKYYIDSNSQIIQFAYYSFDSALVEIFGSLTCGASLIIPGQSLRQNTLQCLENVAEKYQNCTITLPPSLAKELSDETLKNLDTLILAGEECPVGLANRCLNKVHHLINAYGPTESIICATTYEITEEQNTRVPIGYPIEGVKIYFSETGEILIKSNQLFKRYLNTDDDNCIYEHNLRLFKSGDIGRIRKDGAIEYLGRRDNQIKISGQRIEIEGLEAELRDLINTDHIFISPIKNKSNTELIATFISDKDFTRAKQLKRQFPYPMLAWRTIKIDRFPLNHNHKIDRPKLAQIVQETLSKNTHHSSKDGINQKLLEIWQKVFNNLPDSKNARFFESGGDSLRAIRLVSLLQKELNLEVSLSDIIKHNYSFLELQKLIEQKNG